MGDVAERWVRYPSPRPGAALRLFCLPYAGGGSAIFRAWPRRLPPEIEVATPLLPGRESRRQEPPFTRLLPLVRALAEALGPHLDRPFALFGHSMGALVAFELAREIRRAYGLAPVRLFTSGRRAPDRPGPAIRLHTQADAGLVETLRRLEGTPEELLQDPQLVRLVLPTVRADLELCETHVHVWEPPLDCDLTVLASPDDPMVGLADLLAWRGHARRNFRLRLLPGGHFFVLRHEEAVVQAVVEDLALPRPSLGLELRA